MDFWIEFVECTMLMMSLDLSTKIYAFIYNEDLTSSWRQSGVLIGVTSGVAWQRVRNREGVPPTPRDLSKLRSKPIAPRDLSRPPSKPYCNKACRKRRYRLVMPEPTPGNPNFLYQTRIFPIAYIIAGSRSSFSDILFECSCI